MNVALLNELCNIYAPSGEEDLLTNFLINYIEKNKESWHTQPKMYYGKEFQNCIVLVFGKPTTAVFAHIDSIGYTHKYNNELVKLGGPTIQQGYKIVGFDNQGKHKGTLQIHEDDNGYKKIFLDTTTKPERGTNFVFECDFIETANHIQSCYLDNRLGVYNVLELAKTLQNGIICFSCWEETGGGSVAYLSKFIYEKYNVQQALIADITWITNGVIDGQGVAISMRDSGIPRRKYINKIIALAKESNISFQLEVEDAGGSDGNVIQKSAYPVDWCFIGAAESNVHSPYEKVNKKDIASMLAMYKYLMEKL